MTAERRLDRGALARQSRIVDAGAAAGPAGSAAAKQRRAQRRRRRGVGDAHLADCEQIAVRRHGPVSDIDGVQEFVVVHGRRDREVAGRAVEFNSHHPQIGAGQPRDLVDRRAAAGKIRHHLFGDGLRIGRDAARGHAVIAGKDRYRDAIKPRNFAALPVRQPCCQLFETAETSRRFCQRLLPQRGGVGRAGVAAGQIATESADIV